MSEKLHYTYDRKALRAWVEREGIKKFSVQLPAGLIPKSFEILDELSEFGEAVLYAEPAFGACDFPEPGSMAEVDGIVHLGHAPIPGLTSSKKIIFLDLRLKPEIDLAKASFEELGERVGIFATAQYLDFLPKISSFLEEQGIEVYIPGPGKRTYYAGQVLGCEVSPVTSLAERVDSFLFAGDGDFHPKGVAMLTSKPVFRCLRTGKIEQVKFDREKFIKAGMLRASAVRDARNIGILVCVKPGQKRLKLAKQVEEAVRKHGKKPRLIFVNNLSPEILSYLDCDLLVSTACPRIALEDAGNYKIPILTPQEALLGLGEKEDYEIDQFWEAHI